MGKYIVENDIPMAAPVQIQSMNCSVGLKINTTTWKISFIIPNEYYLDLVSQHPVRIKEIPEKEYMVLTYNGRNSNKNYKIHEQEIFIWLNNNNINWKKNICPNLALYDPPWVIYWKLRNEIMVELGDDFSMEQEDNDNEK